MNKDINKILRVAIYIRVSTDRQAKEGDSLEAQESALRTYVKEKGYIIVDTYIDGGESGQKFNRTNLTRMLEDVKKNKVDLILITKLDRWFRSIKDFYKVNEILAQNKVNWKTIWEEYDTTTASGEFFLNMSLSLGQMEAKRTAERIKSVFDYKYNVQKTVCTGAPPFGYKISKEKKLIIDEYESECIKRLYNNYIETNCKAETVRWYQTNIKMISHQTVYKYLKNSVYIGKFRKYNSNEIVENYAPPILSEETFYLVQDMLKRNVKKRSGRKNEKPYIFNGLIFCNQCGLKMNGNCNTKTQKHYYRCPRGINGLVCNNRFCFSEINVEKYIIENILNLIDKKIIELKKIEEKKKDNNKNLSEYKRKLSKLKDLYLDDLIDKETYKKDYEKINEIIKSFNEKDSTKNNKTNYESIKKMIETSLKDIYHTLENDEKRRLWLSIIEKINIEYKEIQGVTLR